MRINSINNTYQYKSSNNNSYNNPKAQSFKGAPTAITEPLSNFYEKVASKGGFQKFISKFSKTNSFTHLMVAESCFLSGFYMINTLRNKKIKKEQKPQMIINDALTLGVSTAGAYLLDDKVTKVVDNLSNSYFTKHQDFYINKAKESAKNLAQKTGIMDDIFNAAKEASDDGIGAVTKKIGEQLSGIVAKGDKTKAFQISADKLKEVQEGVSNAIKANKGNMEGAKKAATGLIDDVYDKLAGKVEADKIIPGINKIKTLVIFGIIYRYLGPVVVTPIANKLSSKFFSNKKDNEAKKA